MRRSKHLQPFVLLVCLLLTAGMAHAQTQPGGVSFKRLFLDYQTLNDGDFGAFRLYTDGLEFSYFHTLSEQLTVDIPVKIGLANDNKEVRNTNLIGLDAHINYYFRNEEKILRPYALAGVGGVLENMDSVNVQFPLGAGLDLRIAPRAYVTWQSEVRVSTKENKNNFNHSIGFKYRFGREEPEQEPLDSDADGITDLEDECPFVPGILAFNGCPDTDSDGVRDQDDECPEVPGLVEFKGCPDSDNDGVPDNEDLCPQEPGVVENNGCPYSDIDGDGIHDMDDSCPELAGLPEYNGCPDTDGDGIIDPEDDCPEVPGLIRFGGCPDTDGDGVRDPDDLCPTMVGLVENNGCPEIEEEDQETLDLAMRSVRFEHGSARLRGDSYEILDQVVDILEKYHEYSLEISGHTDNTGAVDFNQRLSEQRAKACYDYLVSQGIAVKRLSFVGFGESRPISDNDTRAGRQLNRRVEFNLIQGIED